MNINNNISGNSFVQGREQAKKLAIAAAVVCAASLLAGAFNQTLQLYLCLLTIGIMAYLIYTIATRCRCPHCNRVIALGVLQAKQCPSCKRSLTTGKKMKK